jgi:hypothetical protein
VVIALSLVIFYYAVSLAMSPETIRQTVEVERHQLEAAPSLNIPG